MPNGPGTIGQRSRSVKATDKDPVQAARQAARVIATLLGRDTEEVLEALGISTPPGLDADRAKFLQEARGVFERRRRRAKFFSPGMFAEPGWDMLLVLYISDFADVRLTVGRLASWVEAPHTTVLRWLDYLEDKGFIARRRDQNDRRIVFVHLLDQGRSTLDRYFNEISSGLPVGPDPQS